LTVYNARTGTVISSINTTSQTTVKTNVQSAQITYAADWQSTIELSISYYSEKSDACAVSGICHRGNCTVNPSTGSAVCSCPACETGDFCQQETDPCDSATAKRRCRVDNDIGPGTCLTDDSVDSYCAYKCQCTYPADGVTNMCSAVVKTVKSADCRVLRKPVVVRKRWEEYFKELLNEEFPRREVQGEQPTEGPIPSWTQEEVRSAIAKMKLGKAAGPDGVPVDAWKVLGNCEVNWLTQFFSRVTNEGKNPDDWRYSTIVFEQKGDASECSNYRGIKLISHDEDLRTAGRLEAEEDGLISVIKDIYEGSKAAVRTPHGMTKKMDITVGVHQGSALSPFLFVLTLDCIVNHLEKGPLRTILYADDITLVADRREELEEKVQLWQ
uniref:Reverse transcriptase domain-containing protein n=1 Tax=Heligmosomoides polygyrus TaxID=6339 RepID=A0A8L8KRW8_HELPZ